MTSHKEQPAVDTSAEALDAYRFYIDASDAELEARGLTREGALQKARELDPYDGCTPTADALRSLAAHPAEPAGMELETTAEERAQWLSWGDIHLSSGSARRLLRDFDLMRARAEKAEAALKQPVSDEERHEIEAMAQRLDGSAPAKPWDAPLAAGMLRHLDRTLVRATKPAGDGEVTALTAFLRDRAEVYSPAFGRHFLRAADLLDLFSTQLRDAQARGKGMEEALKPFAEAASAIGEKPRDDRPLWAVLFTGWSRREQTSPTMGDLRRARAALSRPEGSAST